MTDKVELRIGCGRVGNKIILEMDDVSAGWLIQELEAPTTEWKTKRGELAALLRRAIQ